MLYCSTQRIESFASRSFFRALLAPASGTGKSAITNANASGWNTRDCREVWVAIVALTAPVALSTVMLALFAGEAVTVWSDPLVIIGGEIVKVAAPDPDNPT